MNNKPKYTLFKNSKYAVDGLIYALKTETSFRIEVYEFYIFPHCVFFTSYICISLY